MRIFTIFLLGWLFAIQSQAQTAINYSLTKSVGTYNSIASTGTSVAIAGDDLAVNITGLSPGITVAGTTYTSARMCSNGWLALYTTAPTLTGGYTALSSTMTNGAVVICPMNADLINSAAGTTAAFRQTIGGEHVFEWVNFSRYSSVTANRTDLLNFQVRLNPATGSITFAYGNTTISPNLTAAFQVGFRSNTNTTWATHVNNLQINTVGSPNTCTWEDAVTGNANNVNLQLLATAPTVAPVNGLTFTFSPVGTLAPVRTFGATTGITSSGATLTWTAPTGATQYDVQYRELGTCAWTDHPGNPVTTNSVTLIGLNGATTYQVRVRSSNGASNTIWSHIPTETGGLGTQGYTAAGTFTTLSNLPPSCASNPTPADGASGTPRNPTFSWTAATGLPAGYDIYLSTSPNPTTPVATVTGTTYTHPSVLAANTIYYWKVVPFNANGQAVGCPEWTFTTGTGFSYCTPTTTFGCTDGDVVARVILNTLDNNSGTGCPSGILGYSDYTNTPPSGGNTFTTNLQAGTVTNCTVFAGQYSESYAVWIDFNDNGVFDHPAERVGFTTTPVAGSGQAGVLGSSASFPISLACNPPVGPHRMRVRAMYSIAGSAMTPCGNNNYGETEDYIITVDAPPPCPQPGGLAYASTTNTLSWTAGCTETVWDLYIAPAGGAAPTGTTTPTVPGITPTPSHNPTGLMVGTTYEVWVRADCGGGVNSVWTGPLTFTLAPPNDECANAITLTPQPFAPGCPSPVAGTTLGATLSAIPTSTNWFTSNDDDVWYQFTATATGHEIRFCNITFPVGTATGINVGWDLHADCATQNVTGGAITITGGSATLTLINLTVGTNYKLRVLTTNTTARMNFDISVVEPDVPPGCATLLTPANMAVAVPVATPLTWSAPTTGGAPVAYRVFVWPSSGTQPTTPTATVGATTFTYTPTGLLDNTQYSWVVVPVNSGGEATGCTPFSYTTDCSISSTAIPYAQDFGTGTTFPAGWANVTATWSVLTNHGQTGSGIAANCYSTFPIRSVRTQKFTSVTAATELKFATRVLNWSGYPNGGEPAAGWGDLQVAVSTDCGSTYTTLATYTDIAGTAWVNKTVSLGAYAGQEVIVRFLGNWVAGDWWVDVDDIEIKDGLSVLSLSQTFIEGYMDGATMRPVLMNSAVVGATATQCDSIVVELHEATAPYAMVATKTVVLNTDGTATASYTALTAGNYYIVIKGRNIIETWSAAPVAFGATATYNFGAAAQAFGNNLGMVGTTPVIYSGDIDGDPFGDGEINVTDYTVWETDNQNGLIGYFKTDLNGDGEVNVTDYTIWENNNAQGILVNKP